jgi:hypothetical protein
VASPKLVGLWALVGRVDDGTARGTIPPVSPGAATTQSPSPFAVLRFSDHDISVRLYKGNPHTSTNACNSPSCMLGCNDSTTTSILCYFLSAVCFCTHRDNGIVLAKTLRLLFFVSASLSFFSLYCDGGNSQALWIMNYHWHGKLYTRLLEHLWLGTCRYCC